MFFNPRGTARRRAVLNIELLESREAPATLVGNNKVTYQDLDGDNVTVTFSKPILTPANVDAVFKFDTGTVNGSNSAKQQLRRIDLPGLGTAASGVNISTLAVRDKLT